MSDHALPPGLSVVIPVYNSASALPDLMARLEPVLIATQLPYECIMVNDGSRDNSWQVVQDLAGKYRWLEGICLMRNHGQHNALLAGIRAARFATTVTIDDDLQHPPEEIPKLLAKLTEGVDVVYGAPEHEQHELMRSIASIITKIALQSAMGAASARHHSAFRVFRTHLREAFADFSSPLVSIDVLLTWGTSAFSMVKVRHVPRPSGKSNYTFGKLARHALNMITGFSTLPLQLASILGLAFSFFGLAILLYVVGNVLLHGSPVAGFPFLASIIAVFSGAQLLALGIFGEYLARIHHRSMGRPAYAVIARTAPHQ